MGSLSEAAAIRFFSFPFTSCLIEGVFSPAIREDLAPLSNFGAFSFFPPPFFSTLGPAGHNFFLVFRPPFA